MQISPKQIIGCESYRQFCDYEYTGQDDLPTGIVYCDILSIVDFFNKIKNNKKKYIVVSPRSDFGLCNQIEHPVWGDLHKAVKMFVKSDHGYNNLRMQARFNKEKCNPDDKYSIKCYSWTEQTFDEIPSNITHWFLTNCSVLGEPKVSSLPFGINNVDGGEEFFETYRQISLKKEESVYANFQFYTSERLEIFMFLKQIDSVTTERDVSFQEYMTQLGQHRFCVCPPGNGWDCYRIWEALYMRCIPIIEYRQAYDFLYNKNYPILFTSSLYAINTNMLNAWYEKNAPNIEWTPEELTLDYWKNQIKSFVFFNNLV
jgi:hypothetical protein